MLIFVYLYYFRSNEPTLAEFIGYIDLIGFAVTLLADFIAFYNTNPRNDQCLTHKNQEEILLRISQGIFAVFICYQFIIQGGWRRLRNRLFYRVEQFGSHLFNYHRDIGVENDYYSVPAIHKFLDNWLINLSIDIAIWTQTEYQNYNSARTASIGMLACFARACSIISLVGNACKLFTGFLTAIFVNMIFSFYTHFKQANTIAILHPITMHTVASQSLFSFGPHCG